MSSIRGDDHSCYQCIRHYGNNYIHHSLDRHLALALLRHVRTGVTPEVAAEDKASVLRGLEEFLVLRGIPLERDAIVDGVKVPLVVTPVGRDVWVDLHHPLVDPEATPSTVALAARASFRELVEIDAFTLVHDLPSSASQLRLPEGWVR